MCALSSHAPFICQRAAYHGLCGIGTVAAVIHVKHLSAMPSTTQLLVPALVLTNAIALCAAYTYRRSLLAATDELNGWVRASDSRRERKLKEKRDKHERRSRSVALHQQRTSTAAHASTPPPLSAAIDDHIAQYDDSDNGEPLPSSNAALDRPLTPPPVDTKHAFHPHSQPYRIVYNTDALLYLQHTPVLPGCPITSLPDVTETPFALPQWRRWFMHAVSLVLKATPADGLAIFYQTDVRCGGEWVSKSCLVIRGAERAGARLVWHKIVVQSSVGSVKGSKAAYAHLLCFSPLPLPSKGKAAAGAASTDSGGGGGDEAKAYVETASSLSADILTSRGAMTWKRAMGLLACEFACDYIRRNTRHRCIVDPFCGQGSVLAVANAQGMDSVGVDTSKRRCCLARQLDVRGRDLAGKGEEERMHESRKQRRERRKQTRHAMRLTGADSERKDEDEEAGDAELTVVGGIFADEQKLAT